jgi:nucleotide-binding universal stress UspA family protein
MVLSFDGYKRHACCEILAWVLDGKDLSTNRLELPIPFTRRFIMIGFKRILCPTDLSEESFKAFPYAFDIARDFDAEIYFINVVNINAPPDVELGFETTFLEFAAAVRKDARRRLEGILSSRVPTDVKFRQIVVQGSAAEQILRAVDDHEIDLVVIATHGLTGWRHMVFWSATTMLCRVGSVAEKVVRQSKVPVLTVCAKLAAPETEKQLAEEVSY